MSLIRRLVSGTAVIAALLAVSSFSARADAPTCSTSQQVSTGCVTAEVGDDDVTLGGEVTTPGRGGGNDEPGEVDPLDDCIYILNDRCLAAGPERGTPVDPVTVADIEAFRPDAGVDTMEPDGWGIVGLDANFYGSTDIRIVDGVLLDQAAAVRFTPIGWRWDYGDGTSRASDDPGRSWASLGLGEFEPTPTSHAYRAPGTFTITLEIEYSAEYGVAGSPWTEVVGTVTLPANSLTATIGDAKTVLVDRECGQRDGAPGC